MKYSIIVPVYNTGKYLDKCIISLINQDYKDYEIIIVNDGSTDNSLDIIDKYSSKYDNIHNYNKENGGLSSARNYGIEKSSGEYLLFVDSDDYLDNNALKIIDENIKDNDILVFNFYMDNGKSINVKNTYFDNISDKCKKFVTANPSACNKVIKRSLFIDNNIKFIDGIYYEDLATIPSFILYTKNINYINDSLYYYCVRDDSIMNKKKYNKRMEDIFKVLDINYNNLNKDYLDEVEYMYIEHLLRYASLRFLDYDNYDNINKII